MGNYKDEIFANLPPDRVPPKVTGGVRNKHYRQLGRQHLHQYTIIHAGGPPQAGHSDRDRASDGPLTSQSSRNTPTPRIHPDRSLPEDDLAIGPLDWEDTDNQSSRPTQPQDTLKRRPDEARRGAERIGAHRQLSGSRGEHPQHDWAGDETFSRVRRESTLHPHHRRPPSPGARLESRSRSRHDVLSSHQSAISRIDTQPLPKDDLEQGYETLTPRASHTQPARRQVTESSALVRYDRHNQRPTATVPFATHSLKAQGHPVSRKTSAPSRKDLTLTGHPSFSHLEEASRTDRSLSHPEAPSSVRQYGLLIPSPVEKTEEHSRRDQSFAQDLKLLISGQLRQHEVSLEMSHEIDEVLARLRSIYDSTLPSAPSAHTGRGAESERARSRMDELKPKSTATPNLDRSGNEVSGFDCFPTSLSRLCCVCHTLTKCRKRRRTRCTTSEWRMPGTRGTLSV